MPNTRVMLWVAFAAILYLNYEAWMHDYREPAVVGAAQSTAGAPGAAQTLADSVPKAEPANGAAAATAAPGLQAAPPPTPPRRRPRLPKPLRRPSASPTLHVETDVLDLSINLKGGEIDSCGPPAVSAAQGHAQRTGAAREYRSRRRCISCRAVSSAARAKPLPRTSRPGHRRKAPTCCRPERRNCAYR